MPPPAPRLHAQEKRKKNIKIAAFTHIQLITREQRMPYEKKNPPAIQAHN